MKCFGKDQSRKEEYGYSIKRSAATVSVLFIIIPEARIYFLKTKISSFKNVNPQSYNRSLLESEIAAIINRAIGMRRYDVAIGVTIVKYFGLRKDELTYLRIHVLEDAIKTKQLHVYNGKGGQERDIPFDTKEQTEILEKILEYTKSNSK